MPGFKKAILVRFLGEPLYVSLREACFRYRECRDIMHGTNQAERVRLTDPRLTGSRRLIAACHNRHREERCFIIGNGPSLRKTDLSLLRNEITFGMNRIYLMFPDLGFETTYYVAVNKLVIEQCADEIAALKMPRFLSCRGSPDLSFPRDVMFLNTTGVHPRFAYDLTGTVWETGTVTNVALQIAFYMGFRTAVLIGVDHSYMSEGPANAEVVSEGLDPNHFSQDYFGKGFRWNLPDLDESERGYRLARSVFEADRREILDATVGGKLTVFRKVNYSDLF